MQNIMDDVLQQADSMDQIDGLFSQEDLDNAALGGGILSESALLQAVDTSYVCGPAQTEQVADFINNGSVTKIAWTKLGMIGRIVEDGTKVELTAQLFDLKTSQWTLLKPWLLDANFDEAVTLGWSHPALELVVLERKGVAHTFRASFSALNRFDHAVHHVSDQADETFQPIAFLWLNLSRGPVDKRKAVLENVKEDNGRWRHEHVEGSYHPPYGIRGLCSISKQGLFTLFFTRDAGPYKTASFTLPVAVMPSLFSHATICQTPEGRLLVSLQDYAGHISAYFVDIAFSPGDLLPTLSAEVIDEEVAAVPPYVAPESQNVLGSTNRWLLTHLYLNPEPEVSWAHLSKPHLKPKEPAILWAVYADYNSLKDAGGNGSFGTAIIKRWRCQKSDFELHSSFGGKSTQSSSGPTTTYLQPLPDTFVHATITNIQAIDPGSTTAITTIDGSTLFYDTDSMTPILPVANPSYISSIGQVNLDFAQLIMSPLQCISQHATVLAYTDLQNKIVLANSKLRDLTPGAGPRDLDVSNPMDEALVAYYITCFSRSIWQNSTCDDIFSSIHANIRPSSLIHVYRQLYLTLFQPKSLVPGPPSVSELEKTPHLSLVPKVLAFHLGCMAPHRSQNGQERIAYLWVWTVLHLRWSIAIIGDTYKSLHTPNQQQGQPQRPGQPPPQPPVLPSELLDLVCHNISWIFNLYNHIFTHLLNNSDRTTHSQFFNAPTFWSLLGDSDANAKQGYVSLMLNCNWSRSFLIIFSRLMKACAAKASLNINFLNEKSQGTIPGALAGTTLGRIAKCIQSNCLRHGITVQAIEALTDNKLHPDQWHMGDEEKNVQTYERQIEMMISGNVLEEYQGTCMKITEECINGNEGLREKGELDRLRLSQVHVSLGDMFLGLDDMGFKYHRLTVDPNAVDGEDDILAYAMDDLAREKESGQTTSTRIGKSGRHGTGVKKPARLLYDMHKKVPLLSAQSLALNPIGPDGTRQQRVKNKEEMLRSQARRCVRCGALSDALLDGVNKGWPRSVVNLMNKCVCEGNLFVQEVGEGIGDC